MRDLHYNPIFIIYFSSMKKKTYVQQVNFKKEILAVPKDPKLKISRVLAVLISPLNHSKVVMDLREDIAKNPLSAV